MCITSLLTVAATLCSVFSLSVLAHPTPILFISNKKFRMRYVASFCLSIILQTNHFTNTDESLNQPSRIQQRMKKLSSHIGRICIYTSALLARLSQNAHRWHNINVLCKWVHPVNVWCAEAENHFTIWYVRIGFFFFMCSVYSNAAHNVIFNSLSARWNWFYRFVWRTLLTWLGSLFILHAHTEFLLVVRFTVILVIPFHFVLTLPFTIFLLVPVPLYSGICRKILISYVLFLHRTTATARVVAH